MEHLPKEAVDAGVRARRARVPNPLTADWLLAEADGYEKTLRRQYPPDGALSSVAEQQLARIAKFRDPLERGLARLGYLKHLYYARTERLRAEEDGQGAGTAARQLLRAEPVEIVLNGRTVHVTDRSYNALAAIVAHDMRVVAAEADARLCEQRFAAVADELAATSWFREPRRWWGIRRDLRRLTRAHARFYAEAMLHRRAIYAHALTPHGRPADDPGAEAPAWWREMRRTDDAMLLLGLWEAGPGRVERLGPPPERPGSADYQRLEDFGFHSLLAWVSKEEKIPPAAPYDRRVGQLHAWLRASADPVHVKEAA